MPSVKGSCMGLDQNNVLTGIVKIISAILCILFLIYMETVLGTVRVSYESYVLLIIFLCHLHQEA